MKLSFNRDWFHPDLLPYIEGIASLVDTFNAINSNIFDLDTLSEEQLVALDWFLGLPSHASGQAISFPLLSPLICDELVEYSRAAKFATNPEEHTQYQIPELVLANHNPQLFNELREFADMSLFLFYNLFWGKPPNTVESIQLAKYTPTGVKKTDWHHDASSNMTGLINLAPELYTGGGTDIRTSLLTFEHIPSIPKGHVLIFNGNMLLHRGSDTLTGERFLLVYWVTTDRS